MMPKPTITQARHICDALKARGVIVLAFTADNFAAASYGETKGECQQLRNTLDAIMDGIEDGEIPVWNGHAVTPDERIGSADKTIAALTAERDAARRLLARSKSVLMSYHRKLGPNGPAPGPLEVDIDAALAGVCQCCFGDADKPHTCGATCKDGLRVESERERFRRYLRENAEEVRKWPEWMRLGTR